jgi:aspartate kinase
VPKADYKKAVAVVEGLDSIQAKGITIDSNIAKVSIIGVGMRTHAGVAARMFKVLSREGINIEMISTSEIKVSVVIDAKQMEQAVKALHQEFIENQAAL